MAFQRTSQGRTTLLTLALLVVVVVVVALITCNIDLPSSSPFCRALLRVVFLLFELFLERKRVLHGVVVCGLWNSGTVSRNWSQSGARCLLHLLRPSLFSFSYLTRDWKEPIKTLDLKKIILCREINFRVWHFWLILLGRHIFANSEKNLFQVSF